MQYQGKKFFYTHSTFKPSDNYYSDEKTETRHFLMTKPYKEYLRDKRAKELENEINILKEKLNYQYKHYGQVDDLDFKYYVYLLNKINQ